MIKGQDILVLLKLLSEGDGWTYGSLAEDLQLSPSAVHRAIDRASEAGLFDAARRAPAADRLSDFLVHAAQYIFPARLGGETRGMPTAWAAPPLSEHLSASRSIPVWPYAKGKVRGQALEPIHPAVPLAALSDADLAQSLALVDGIRIGNARERGVASRLIEQRVRSVRR